MHDEDRFETTTTLWRGQSVRPGTSWHFPTIDGRVSAEIRCAAPGRTCDRAGE
jgi:hypothetical protein